MKIKNDTGTSLHAVHSKNTVYRIQITAESGGIDNKEQQASPTHRIACISDIESVQINHRSLHVKRPKIVGAIHKENQNQSTEGNNNTERNENQK